MKFGVSFRQGCATPTQEGGWMVEAGREAEARPAHRLTLVPVVG
jgi:hypothetical protein